MKMWNGEQKSGMMHWNEIRYKTKNDCLEKELNNNKQLLNFRKYQKYE